MPRVTIKDIAARAGVSHVTVSHALRGSSVVKAETRQRVERVAREMGYRPNLAARSTRTGRFDAVALLLPAARAAYLPGEKVVGLVEGLARHGLHLTVEQVPDQRLTDANELPKLMRDLACDGLLVNYLDDTPAGMAQLIRKFELPTIYLNTKRAWDCVRPDDENAGRRAARELLSRGHRRILFARAGSSGSVGHYSVIDRYAGFAAEMQAAGLEPVEAVCPFTAYAQREDPCADSRLAWCRDLLTSSQRPSAIVLNERALPGPMVHQALMLGLELGRDLSLLALSGTMVDDVGVAVHTLRHSSQAMGGAAADAVAAKIAQPRQKLPARLVEFDWRPGVTLGRPATT